MSMGGDDDDNGIPVRNPHVSQGGSTSSPDLSDFIINEPETTTAATYIITVEDESLGNSSEEPKPDSEEEASSQRAEPTTTTAAQSSSTLTTYLLPNRNGEGSGSGVSSTVVNIVAGQSEQQIVSALRQGLVNDGDAKIIFQNLTIVMPNFNPHPQSLLDAVIQTNRKQALYSPMPSSLLLFQKQQQQQQQHFLGKKCKSKFVKIRAIGLELTVCALLSKTPSLCHSSAKVKDSFMNPPLLIIMCVPHNDEERRIPKKSLVCVSLFLF